MSKLYTLYYMNKGMKIVKRCKITLLRDKEGHNASVGLKKLTSIDICT